MEITLQTKVHDLLEKYPFLEEKLISISPVFAKLKNPVLRKTVAKVATLRQIAEVAAMDPPKLVALLRQALGLETTIGYERSSGTIVSRPGWADEQRVTKYLDVRPILEGGQSPMEEVLRLCKQLERGELLKLTCPFKPAPLMEKLESKGFACWSEGSECYVLKK